MEDYYDEDSLDAVASNIIDQIKNQGKSLKSIEKDYPELSVEDVDAFVLKYGSMAVIDLSDALKEQAEVVRQTGDANHVLALSELARSFQGNLEVLQKRSIADKKNETAVKIKTMDIQSKKEIQESDETARLMMSREELFKMLVLQQKEEPKKVKNSTKVIDI
jgi:uncharacterized protein (DUF433 family)